MAKTDLTKRIENRLSTYRPKELGDYKLNYMRDQYDMYEVPVTHGAVQDGLIDYVWLAEGFRNVRHVDICRAPYYAKNGWFSENNNCAYDIDAFRHMLDDEPPIDDNLCIGCRYKSYKVLQDDTPAIICFEIKISKADFHSSHGHNFVGNLNYYVMPLDLYKEVSSEIPPEIGCIVFSASDKQDTLRKRKDAVWQDTEPNLYSSMLLTCMNKYRKRWSQDLYKIRQQNSNYYDDIMRLIKENTILKRDATDSLPACFLIKTPEDYMLKSPDYYKFELTNCRNDYKEQPECETCIFHPMHVYKVLDKKYKNIC